jgi:hypothetical protein
MRRLDGGENPDLSQVYHRLPAAAKADFPSAEHTKSCLCRARGGSRRDRVRGRSADFAKADERFTGVRDVFTSLSQARDLSFVRSGRSGWALGSRPFKR